VDLLPVTGVRVALIFSGRWYFLEAFEVSTGLHAIPLAYQQVVRNTWSMPLLSLKAGGRSHFVVCIVGKGGSNPFAREVPLAAMY